MTDTITVTLPILAGLVAAIEAAGHSVTMVGNGTTWLVDDASAVEAIVNSYVGSVQQLAYVQGEALAALAAQYAAVIAAGFNYTVAGDPSGSHNYQIDPQSQANITAMGSLASATVGSGGAMTWPSGFYWVDAANNQVAMTAQQMLAFAAAVATYVSGCVLTNRALKDAILAATTVAAVEAIDVTSGWPTNG